MSLDADEVTPGLWQGSKLQPGIYPFDLIVLTAAEWQLPGETFGGTTVLRVPLHDVYTKTVVAEQLPRAIAAAQEVFRARRAGKRVLVICAAGWNRSGLVNALALRIAGLSADQAIGLIKRARGVYALGNEAFQKQIRDFVPPVVKPTQVLDRRRPPSGAIALGVVIAGAIALLLFLPRQKK